MCKSVQVRVVPILFWAGITLLVGGNWAEAITLTGSNGRKVEFAGIKDATPKGITGQLTEEAPLIGVPWSKLDLNALRVEHELIFAAYEMSQKGETVALDLGSYGKGTTGEPDESRVRKGRWPGWTDVDIGGVRFLMQTPLGAPRAILVVAKGDNGRGFKYLMGHEKGSGAWGEFQNKYSMAIVSYEYGPDDDYDPTTIDDFVYPEKKSGMLLMQAMKAFADKIGNPEIAELPIAIYGTDRIGAAFAYNMVQWRPEKILGAVAAKGAFFTGTPSEASSKVPMLLLWGEYSNEHELWRTEDTAEKVFAGEYEFPLHWTNAPEFRGGGEMNGYCEYFSQQYLLEVIGLRLAEKVVPPKVEEKPEGEEGSEGKAGEEKEEEPEEPEKPKRILELDRSVAWVGDVKAQEIDKMKDPASELGENETYLPNEKVAKLWKSFVTNDLELPNRTGVQ
jgi:hypothetical protein